MRTVALFLTSLLAATPSPPPAAQPPAPEPGFERWLWNARERTAAGLAALEAGEGEAAVGALETAARVAPADPWVRFNAGAGRLHALPGETGDADSVEQRQAAARAAIPHLQAAAGAAPAPLATDALYDLGTAQLLAGEPRAAVESLAEALRRDGRREDAKHNLELALRALEEQEQRQRQEEKASQPESRPAPEPQSGDERSDGAGTPQPQQPEQGAPQETPQETPQAPRGADPESPLPNFVDQPNLNAREAAALLEAVENRERQQRRESAAARAKERRTEEKDW